jgi:hypothetical protein
MQPSNNDDLRYVEKQIAEWIKAIDHTSHQSIMAFAYDGKSVEHADFYVTRGLKYLYNLICAYLEIRVMPNYLELFKSQFDVMYADEKKLLEASFAGPDELSPELDVLLEIRRFLAPFKAFDSLAVQEDSNDRLKEILADTPFIIKQIPDLVSTEVEIYKRVHWVLKLMYPTCVKPDKPLFTSIFKRYEPDILIPELGTAIEYKLIRDKKHIEEYIDQVRIDATNYKGDRVYTKFIAVLCIQDNSIASKKSVYAAWNKKEFPGSWSLIVAFL